MMLKERPRKERGSDCEQGKESGEKEGEKN